jgi:AAA ATPase domain
VARVIGREREFGELTAILERRSPALVLVTGEAGMGKTTLVRAMQDQSATDGWTPLPKDSNSAPLVADRSTTPESFSGAFHRAFGGAADEALAELPETLAAHAPVLLLIEFFRPTRVFANWLSDALMGELRSAAVPAVVVVTTAFDSDKELLAHAADVVVRLGPLDAEDVRKALLELPPLDPPLDDHELGIYVEEASRAPAVLSSLLRLLRHVTAVV